MSDEPAPTPVRVWLGELQETIDDFVSSRPIVAATVAISLQGGRRVYVKALKAGPGPTHLTIDPYPPRHGDLIDSEFGRGQTPTRLVVGLSSIAQVELFADSPSTTPLGFTG